MVMAGRGLAGQRFSQAPHPMHLAESRTGTPSTRAIALVGQCRSQAVQRIFSLAATQRSLCHEARPIGVRSFSSSESLTIAPAGHTAKGVVIKTTLNYIEKHRKELTKSYRNFKEFNRKFEVSDELLNSLRTEGESNGVTFNEQEYNLSLPLIKTQLKALIARDLWEMNEYYQVMNQTDNVVQQALKIIEEENTP